MSTPSLIPTPPIIRDSNNYLLSPDKEETFKHFNPVFCEANETISLSSSAADTSFVNERNVSHDESEGSSYSESENPTENSEDETQTDKNTAPPAQKKKIVAAPHKKSKQMRPNKEALSEIAQILKSFSEAQNKLHQKTLDEERWREERFLEFKREEAEKDRQHELRLAQMLSANMYHARAFLFQLETSKQIVSASNQSFHTSVFPRQ